MKISNTIILLSLAASIAFGILHIYYDSYFGYVVLFFLVVAIALFFTTRDSRRENNAVSIKEKYISKKIFKYGACLIVFGIIYFIVGFFDPEGYLGGAGVIFTVFTFCIVFGFSMVGYRAFIKIMSSDLFAKK